MVILGPTENVVRSFYFWFSWFSAMTILFTGLIVKLATALGLGDIVC
jgi:hypothetical protein